MLYSLGLDWKEMAEIIILEVVGQGVGILELSQEGNGLKGFFVDGFNINFGELSLNEAVEAMLYRYSLMLLFERVVEQLGLIIEAKGFWG